MFCVFLRDFCSVFFSVQAGNWPLSGSEKISILKQGVCFDGVMFHYADRAMEELALQIKQKYEWPN